MKLFLYILTSLRSGSKDGVVVAGGTHYYKDQLLTVIEANDAEHAAQALNTEVVDYFDRSSVNLPTIYYTSSYFSNRKQPQNHEEGYFFLSLKEPEKGDDRKHPDLKGKIRLKVTAPPLNIKSQ